MSVQESAVPAGGQHHDPLDEQVAVARQPPHPALAAYRARTKRLRIWYLAALCALIAAAVVLVEVVMANSEVASAQLHTAKTAAPAIAPAVPSTDQRLAWRTGDSVAIGQAVWSGTVVTYSSHTVTGRDGRTGTPVWSYTRTDATICQVAQQQGKTMAFFIRDGDCDEVDTFDTNTGARAWSRTLFSNSMLIRGSPTIQVSQYTVLLVTGSLVQAIDPATGYDRWHFQQPAGCETTSAALGSTGVLIGQQCRNGNFVLLRDPYAGDDSTTSTKWRVSTARVFPATADELISALEPATGHLLTYDASKGSSGTTMTLTPRPGSTAGLTAISANGTELIWVDGNGYAISSAATAQQWSDHLAGAPVLADSQLLATNAEGVVALDAHGGSIVAAYRLPGTTPDSTVYPLGTGFVIGHGQDGTAVYQ